MAITSNVIVFPLFIHLPEVNEDVTAWIKSRSCMYSKIIKSNINLAMHNK